MFSLKILYDLREEMQHTAMEIRTANSYDDACADWKAECDHLVALRDSGVLSSTLYQNYFNMLNQAMTD